MPISNNFHIVHDPNNPTAVQPHVIELRQNGPRVNVEISITDTLASVYQQDNKEIPNPHTGKALIDTGASMTAVDKTIINSLGLSPIGVTKVFTPSGEAEQELYPAKLSFPGIAGLTINFNSVLCSDLSNQGIAALIGRDVLTSFVLIYNGLGAYFTLAF